jgi:hypothetical protein
MASLARTAAVIALVAPLTTAITSGVTAGANVELAYLPWAGSSQSLIQPFNGNIWSAGARRPHHKRYSPPPPGNRWRDASATQAERSGTPANSAVT